MIVLCTATPSCLTRLINLILFSCNAFALPLETSAKRDVFAEQLYDFHVLGIVSIIASQFGEPFDLIMAEDVVPIKIFMLQSFGLFLFCILNKYVHSIPSFN